MSPYTITNLCKTISVISLLSLQVTATAQINFGDNYITPGIYSSVAAGGGKYNDGPESLIGGGDSNRNQTNAPYSFIGGGFYNANLNLGATIVGGAYNTNVGYLATIG